MDSNAAGKMLQHEEETDAALIAKKPYACLLCPKRYVKETGLAKHIRDRHTYPGVVAAPAPAPAAAPAAALAPASSSGNVKPAHKTKKVCPVCGGNANHKSKHETTTRHTRALAAQTMQ